MSGKNIFQIDPENRPNRTVSERVVSERGRKELPPGTKGGENLKPDRHYEHKQYAFDSYCKKVLKCEACNGYRQISRHQKRFTSLEELSEAEMALSLIHISPQRMNEAVWTIKNVSFAYKHEPETLHITETSFPSGSATRCV